MPKSAITIGSPIASSDPNATSRMRMAAVMPTISAGPTSGFPWKI